MGTLAIVLIFAAVVVAYLVSSSRKDRQSDRDHQAVMSAMSPGPRIHEMTSVRPSPLSRNRMAQGSRAIAPVADDFAHVGTDYGTYTPADVEAATPHHDHSCAEVPAHHDTFDSSSCDVGGHHGD